MPEIRALGAQPLDRDRPVLLDHRVRYAVRKAAVRLVKNLDELERQMRLEEVDDRAGAAVAGIDDDLERCERVEVDVRQQMLDVGGLDVDLPHLAARGDGRPELVTFREAADVLQAGVGADRPRPLADEFHAVVVRRIVAGRDHDAAVELHAERREIGELRAADADVEHVDAGVRQPLHERDREPRARAANVAADGNGSRLARMPRSRGRCGTRCRRRAPRERGRERRTL